MALYRKQHTHTTPTLAVERIGGVWTEVALQRQAGGWWVVVSRPQGGRDWRQAQGFSHSFLTRLEATNALLDEFPAPHLFTSRREQEMAFVRLERSLAR